MSNINLFNSLGCYNSRSFHETLYKCTNELFGLTRDEFNERWKPRNAGTEGTLRGYTQPTADALFERWKATRDWKWLYEHPEYKWDSLGVSTFQTSATTLGGINLMRKHGVSPKKLFDWGAGPGFSSLLIAKNFPRCDVLVNECNADLRKIFCWFAENARVKNVRLVDEIEPECDAIQAYEITEHIEHSVKKKVGDPVTVLSSLLDKLTPTAYMLHSSCWSAENRYMTLGHFLVSDVDGKITKNTRVGMHFRAAMKRRGWEIIAAGFNSRPHLYKRSCQ